MPDAKKIGKHFTRAMFDVASINKDARTVDVVFATETPVLRQTWDGPVNEILVCNPANVRMERINSGAPVLDTHDKYSVKTQLGVVENARFEGNTLKATLRFSNREDVQGVWQDIQDGIVRNVSVGYRVYEYETTERLDTKISDYRATDWEPFEISMVPVPADYNSSVRADDQETNEVKITKKNTNMKIAAQIIAAVRAAGLSMDFAETLLRNEDITMDDAQRQIDAEKAKNPAPAPAPAADPQRAAEPNNKAGMKTAADILHSVRAAGLNTEFGTQLLEMEGITLARANELIIKKLAENQAGANTRSANASVNPNADELDKMRTGVENAILHRVAPATYKAADAGEFRGMTLERMAEEVLTKQGVSVRGMSRREIAQTALNLNQRTHTTSDFPNILGSTVNRTLRSAYQMQPRTFTPFCAMGSASDFRAMTRLQLSDFVAIDKIVEGSEYKYGTMSEGKETYSVVKYGKRIAITWEALINDDLSAFSRIPQAMATSVASKQSDIVYAILTANAAMGDNTALFHANHGNLTSTGTDISIDSLGVARKLFRKQTAPNGTILNLEPKFLIVSPDKEQVALQYTSANYVAATATTQNVWSGMATPIVEGRLTGNTWYMAATPSMIDTIEYSFLDGEELYTEQRTGFEVDGLEIKVRMVFGAKALDWRGLYKNVGA